MNLNSEKGSVASLVAMGLVLIFVLYSMFFFVFGEVVPPNMIGLRQNYYSLGFMPKGYLKEGLLPGLQWKIPFISEVHLIPRDFQFVAFNADTSAPARAVSGRQDRATPARSVEAVSDEIALPIFKSVLKDENTNPALYIPTADGSKVRTDMTLVIRYFEGPETIKNDQKEASEQAQLIESQSGTASKEIPVVSFATETHGGPGDLVNSYTDSRKIQLERVSQISENEIKKAMSQLSTTNYYDPVPRETKVLDAQTAIQKALNPAGIQLWGALIRRYVYQDQAIDDQIFEKNLQEQKERLNATLSDLAKEKAETERLVANWDAKIGVLKVEGDTVSSVVKSQGDLYEAQRRAEGDLQIAEAKARVDSEKAKVLSEVTGAEVYVAREMVPLLETISGGVVTGLDPFNVNAWVEKLTNTGGK